jgi:hypothetical protein
VNDKLQILWKESRVAYFKVLSRIHLERLWKTTNNISYVTGLCIEILTRHVYPENEARVSTAESTLVLEPIYLEIFYILFPYKINRRLHFIRQYVTLSFVLNGFFFASSLQMNSGEKVLRREVTKDWTYLHPDNTPHLVVLW